MTRTAPGALLVLSLVLPVTSSARDQQPDEMISKALVERLLESFGYLRGGARLVEGAPDDFPTELLPEGAVVRLSVRAAPTTKILAEAPTFTDASRPRFERQMAAAGWTAGPSYGGTTSRGLMASPSRAPDMFCHGARYASYTTSPRRGGGSWLHISLMTGERMSPCSAGDGTPRSYRSLFDDLEVPGMEPPPDSLVVGSMTGGSSGNVAEQQLRLKSELNAREVADHYAERLTTQSWTLLARADAEGVSITRFAVPGKKEMVATLGIVTLPDGNVDVSLRLLTPERKLF